MKKIAILAVVLLLAIVALPHAAAQEASYKDIKYPALGKFEIPKPVTFTLKNGMTVFMMEDHELPLIDVGARIRTGSNWEPAAKTGLAGITGMVQRTGGTAKMTGDQVDDFLAARAATVETGIGNDAGSAMMSCLRDDFDEVFKIYVDVLRVPAFAQDKLDVAKVQANSGIARRNDNVGGITGRELAKLVYGADSPLARTTEYETIAAITRDDLVAWHKQYYVPNNIILSVSGDFDGASMRKKIEAAFGDWAKGTEFKQTPAPMKPAAPGFYFIEKSDVNQANIAFGHVGIEMKNPDFFAAAVMNEVLSGGFGARMFSNVRSKKGLAYSVSAGLGADNFQPGMFRAGLQTKSENMAKGIDAVMVEIKGIIDSPPDDAELKRAKDSILNSFVFNYDSKRKVLAQQVAFAYYGLGADRLEQYRANIEKVTKDDVARVAKKYVHPGDLAILVVGKAADFDKPLASLGKVTNIDITIPAPPDKGPKVEKNAATADAGKKLWQKVVKALGGPAPEKVDAIRSGASIAMSLGPQTMTIKQTSTMVYPDKVHQVLATPMGERAVLMMGEEGWSFTNGQATPLPAQAVADTIKERGRSLNYLLRYNGDPEIQAVAAGSDKSGDTPCEVLSIAYKGAESRLCVADDGKVLKQSYQGKNPMTGVPGAAEVTYSDYRPEGGMLLAHKMVMMMDGKEVRTVTLESFELNPKVDPGLFAKPEAPKN